MLTIDANGNTVRVPDEEVENLLKETADKNENLNEKVYTVNTAIPLVVDKGRYIPGATINVNMPFATEGTFICIDIKCIRGFKLENVDIEYTDGKESKYLQTNQYKIEENGPNTYMVTFTMPKGNVDFNSFIVKES